MIDNLRQVKTLIQSINLALPIQAFASPELIC
jgi:hypothetical protein